MKSTITPHRIDPDAIKKQRVCYLTAVGRHTRRDVALDAGAMA